MHRVPQNSIYFTHGWGLCFSFPKQQISFPLFCAMSCQDWTCNCNELLQCLVKTVGRLDEGQRSLVEGQQRLVKALESLDEGQQRFAREMTVRYNAMARMVSHSTDAPPAMASSTESSTSHGSCPICQEDLFEPIHRMKCCGNELHSYCWSMHVVVHATSVRGEDSPNPPRRALCPFCRKEDSSAHSRIATEADNGSNPPA